MRRCCKYDMAGGAGDWRSGIGDSVDCSPSRNSCSTPDSVISVFCTYFFFRNSSPPPLPPPTRGGEYSLFPCIPPPVPLTEGEKGGGGGVGGGEMFRYFQSLLKML